MRDSLTDTPGAVRSTRAWADSGITGLTLVTGQPEAMELMASPR